MSRPASRRYVSVSEAAVYLGLSERTVREWIRTGRLRGYRAGPKVVRLRMDELDAAMTPFGGEVQ
jgi:excisionase family DNA binding protein